MRRDQNRYPVRREQDWGLSPWGETGLGSPFAGSPWQMMRRMHEDMDRIFGHFFESGLGGGLSGTEPGRGGMSLAGGQQWAPSVDVSQTDREWCIEADLPGVSKDAINVEVQDHHLVLSAEMRQEEGSPQDQGRERQYARRERRYGYFQRVIPLPDNVDEEQIRCEFRDGVLSVHVPKTERQQPGGRRIPITDGRGQAPGLGSGAQEAGRTGSRQTASSGAPQPAVTGSRAGSPAGGNQAMSRSGASGATVTGPDPSAMDEEAEMAGAKGGEVRSESPAPPKRTSRKKKEG